MNKIKVSVVIPVYNTEQFLKECLDSLVNQTLKEIEIICVDDGSTDNSLSVLKEYEKKYGFIKVLSQENAGAGIARNHGLEYVQGEYVSFIDSDDWLELDAFEKLYKNAKIHNSDLVFFNAIEQYPDRVRKRIYFPNNEDYTKNVFNYKDNKKIVMNGFLIACTKLHRTKLIKENDIQFKDFPVNNDVAFHIETTILAKRISYVPDILYHYRRDEPVSLQSSTVKSKKGFVIIKLFEVVEKLLNEHDLMDEFELNFLNFKFGESEVRLNNIAEEYKNEFLHLLQNDFKKMNISLDVLKKIQFKRYQFYIHVLNAKNYKYFDRIHNFQNYKNLSFPKNFISTSIIEQEAAINDLKIENEILTKFYDDCLKGNEIIEAIKLIKKYGLFDDVYYKNTYNYNLNIDPILHYIYKGYDENMSPSEIFDADFYLNFNENAKKSNLNPLVYFVLHGMDEGKIKINADVYQPNTINKKIIIEEIKNFNDCGINLDSRNERIIVSLTSFPERMYDIHFCLYSLMKQTLKPDKIILWLAETQFPNKEKDLPQNVLNLKKFGLEIEWCDDLKSYKKLIPALKKYPNDIIITVDDDLYYKENLIETLYDDHVKYPNTIISTRFRKIKIENGSLTNYEKWDISTKPLEPSYLNFSTNGAGSLFPPNSLHELVLNYDLARELCPQGDDIWFWGMAVLNHTKIRGIEKCTPYLTCVNPSRESNIINEKTLWSSNKKGNNVQISHLLEYFPEIKNIVIEEFSRIK